MWERAGEMAPATAVRLENIPQPQQHKMLRIGRCIVFVLSSSCTFVVVVVVVVRRKAGQPSIAETRCGMTHYGGDVCGVCSEEETKQTS